MEHLGVLYMYVYDLFCFSFQDRTSPGRPVWPGAPYVDHRDLPASATQMKCFCFVITLKALLMLGL